MFKRTHKRSFEVFVWKIFEVIRTGVKHYRICNFRRRCIVLDFRAVPGFAVGLVHLELVGWVVVLAWGCWSRDLLPISMGTRESGEVRE